MSWADSSAAPEATDVMPAAVAVCGIQRRRLINKKSTGDKKTTTTTAGEWRVQWSY